MQGKRGQGAAHWMLNSGEGQESSRVSGGRQGRRACRPAALFAVCKGARRSSSAKACSHKKETRRSPCLHPSLHCLPGGQNPACQPARPRHFTRYTHCCALGYECRRQRRCPTCQLADARRDVALRRGRQQPWRVLAAQQGGQPLVGVDSLRRQQGSGRTGGSASPCCQAGQGGLAPGGGCA